MCPWIGPCSSQIFRETTSILTLSHGLPEEVKRLTMFNTYFSQVYHLDFASVNFYSFFIYLHTVYH